MNIPIPAHKKRFTIRVCIAVSQAMHVGFHVYDPRYQNTHYFRRKAYLKRQEKRTIYIPLPVSPEELILTMYNKETGSAEGIDIIDFTIQPMEAPVSWITPEQQRFMDFSIAFAQKAGYAPAGFYDSPDNEFLFQYLPRIVDQYGKELITPARIHRKMPRVQLSQRLFRSYTIPVRVAILSHEGCHWFLNTRSEKTADLCGIRHYLDYGFPKIEAVYAATKIFSQNPHLVGETQVRRTKDIIHFINQYTSKV